MNEISIVLSVFFLRKIKIPTSRLKRVLWSVISHESPITRLIAGRPLPTLYRRIVYTRRTGSARQVLSPKWKEGTMNVEGSVTA